MSTKDLEALATSMENLQAETPNRRAEAMKIYAALSEQELVQLDDALRFRRSNRPTLDLSK